MVATAVTPLKQALNPVTDGARVPLGYQHIADCSTAQTLTVPSGAQVAIIQALSNNINWRDDGTSPVNGTTGGMLLAAGDSFLYVGDLARFEGIETTNAATAALNISYYA